MVRTSQAQPSNLDAGALDDLDLDDMFADDGDMLFEGLDIQLEGMGDLIATDKKDTSKKIKEEEEQGDESPKRRKTKRKTKAPVAYGDDDEDYMEESHPKKKVRKSKSIPPPAPVTSKKKKTKKETSTTITTTTVAAVPPPPIVSKTKKSLIPPPTAGIIRGGSGAVAAAGRFGKRTSGASATTTTITATTSTKLKRKQKDISTAAAAAPTSPPVPPEPTLFVPKQESTYGGLHPSKTHFYPFLESIPPEPSMKNRKQFSHLDKISMALNNFLTNGSNGETPLPDAAIAKQAGWDMNSPIVQLLLETFEAISEKDKVAFGENKKQALVACVPELRATVEGLEPSKLLSDLYGMCGLLTRQYNFLKTSLKNMETWCQATFSDTDYRQAYSLPEPFKPEKVGTVITSANRKWKKSVIPVKIVFAGHKEVKGTPMLLARLPAAVVHPDKKKKEDAPKKKKKPAEKVVTPTALPSMPAPVTAKPPAAPKAYADCPPAERRQRILEKVAQLALALECQLNDRRTKRSSTGPTVPSSSSAASNAASTKTANDKAAATTVTATYIPQEEPPLHTARMWEWLDVAGFFHSTSPADGASAIKHAGALRLQSPEIFPRGLLLPTPSRILGRLEPEGVVDPPVSSSSLYDRLQSLLVIEDSDDDHVNDKGNAADHANDDSDTDSDDEESLGFLDADSDDDDADGELEGMEKSNHTRKMADLSKLSTEERTFLHLCSAGLVKKSSFPMVELVLEDNSLEGALEDDIVNVIGNMSTDLSTLTARNNARIGFLEAAMDPMEVAYRKQLEEEQASAIAKCHSLLKRSKEKAKKSNKNRSSVSSTKDDLNLPW